MLASEKPTFAELWPNLRLIITWTGGSCRIALAAVRRTLPPGVCIAELGYLSSEFRGTITVDLERNVGAPTIHENFFEFVERDDWDAGRKEFRTVEEIEEGQEYYIFITTGAGLYRYFMNDIVAVTGLFQATPAIEFVRKGKGVTNITGEKLSENQVVSAVRSTEDALGLASGFFLMLADAEGAVYRLVVEWSGTEESIAERLIESVEQKLGELNVEYAQKRASGRLRHLEARAGASWGRGGLQAALLRTRATRRAVQANGSAIPGRVRLSVRRFPHQLDSRDGAVRIEALDLYRIAIPFKESFRHSSADRAETQSVWTEARAGGLTGVGEGCPREYVTSESLSSALAFFARRREGLCEQVHSAGQLAAWVRENQADIDQNPAAWCAIELAILELFALREGVPVEGLLAAAPPSGRFRYSAVIGDSEPEVFRKTAVRYREAGFRDFKVKLSGDPRRDSDKITALCDLNIEGLCIRVDANNLWDDAGSAAKHLAGLEFPFTGIEEPLTAGGFDAMRLVSEQTGAPIIWTKASSGRISCRRSPSTRSIGLLTFASPRWADSCGRSM